MIWTKSLAFAAAAGELWGLIVHFVSCGFAMWVESRFDAFGLVVLAKVEGCEAGIIKESMSSIAVSGGGRRHERASGGNCCFGSRDGEWLRRNQRVGSEVSVAR